MPDAGPLAVVFGAYKKGKKQHGKQLGDFLEDIGER